MYQAQERGALENSECLRLDHARTDTTLSIKRHEPGRADHGFDPRLGNFFYMKAGYPYLMRRKVRFMQLASFVLEQTLHLAQVTR